MGMVEVRPDFNPMFDFSYILFNVAIWSITNCFDFISNARKSKLVCPLEAIFPLPMDAPVSLNTNGSSPGQKVASEFWLGDGLHW